jgi:micrococcal nuclease
VLLVNRYKLLFLVLCFACSPSGKSKDTSIKGLVIAIKDGDTIDLLYENEKLTIRLAHIDCPEKSQPFGAAAKDFTSRMCFNQIVIVETGNKYDRDKRLLGIVVNSQGEIVNKELVKAGLAWHYKKYSTDNEYAQLEIFAKNAKLGLWADSNPSPPWLWRKLSKKTLGISSR